MKWAFRAAIWMSLVASSAFSASQPPISFKGTLYPALLKAGCHNCHNPDGVDLLGWQNYHSWILSGHTHGGQCKPPFLPPPLLPVINRRYTSGEFDLSGSRRLYISRGIGHIMKVRFNMRPEVTLFELTSV